MKAKLEIDYQKLANEVSEKLKAAAALLEEANALVYKQTKDDLCTTGSYFYNDESGQDIEIEGMDILFDAIEKCGWRSSSLGC